MLGSATAMKKRCAQRRERGAVDITRCTTRAVTCQLVGMMLCQVRVRSVACVLPMMVNGDVTRNERRRESRFCLRDMI